VKGAVGSVDIFPTLLEITGALFIDLMLYGRPRANHKVLKVAIRATSCEGYRLKSIEL